MTSPPVSPIWRPPAEIRAKVLGIVVQGGALLAMEVMQDDGSLKGVRPPGGTIEFGETREQALRREFQEELSAEVDINSDWTVFENIYTHHGVTGHEFIFAAAVSFRNAALYTQPHFTIPQEGTARWFPVAALLAGETELYPMGLGAWLEREKNY